jgi:anti-sigma-K factor RskA
VSEIFQNNPYKGVEALSSHSHDEFKELCALSTSDALTLEEWNLLNEHLQQCASCRALKAQYETVAFDLMPALSARIEERAAAPQLNEEQQPSSQALQIPSSRWTTGWRVAAGIIILFADIVIYGIFARSHQSHNSIVSSTLPPVSTSAITSVEHVQNDLQENKSEIALLRNEVKRQRIGLEQLKAERSRLENKLTQRTIDLEHGSHERSLLDQRAASAEGQVRELKDRVDETSSREAKVSIQLAGLQTEVADLQNRLQQRDREIAADQDLLKHDRDIRDLIAARDLYIVDVYDTKKSGAFQKPVGRVFYTKDKSLVFYGYNLDQQSGLTNASTFQVWGTTRTNEGNISLGLFYRDDTNRNRWILKYNDAKTIAQLDRIFVTVEPEGGSKQPTGKPLLTTSLRIEPNHP